MHSVFLYYSLLFISVFDNKTKSLHFSSSQLQSQFSGANEEKNLFVAKTFKYSPFKNYLEKYFPKSHFLKIHHGCL